MPFVAGQKIRAQELNDLLTGAVLGADVTVNNSTTLVNAPGLAIPLAADATYGLDGWLIWSSNPTADIRFQYSFPAGATGWWAGIGPHVSSAPVSGSERINYVDFGAVALSAALAFAGDDEFTSTVYPSGMPRGFIRTTGGGTLQLRFAQNTANASNTILRAGSWLRLTRLD